MFIKLPDAEQAEVVAITRKRFSDFPLFDRLVLKILKEAIAQGLETTNLNLKKKANGYFAKALTDDDEKIAVKHARLIIICGFSEVLARTEGGRKIMEFQMHTFLFKYHTDFDALDDSLSDEKLTFLFDFWKFNGVTLLGLPAYLNKELHVDVACRMAGDQRPMVVGGGQRKIADCLVLIYETEGKVTAEKRPEPRLKGPSSAPSKPAAKLSSKIAPKSSSKPSRKTPTKPASKPASKPSKLRTRKDSKAKAENNTHIANSIVLTDEQIARLTCQKAPLLDAADWEMVLSDLEDFEAYTGQDADMVDTDVAFAQCLSALPAVTPERAVSPRANTRTYSEMSLGNTTLDTTSDSDHCDRYYRNDPSTVVVLNLDYSCAFGFGK